MMKRLFLLLIALVLCPTYPAAAQYSLEVGAAMYTASQPHSAGYLSVLMREVGGLQSFTTIEMRPISTSEASYSTRTGVLRRVYADRLVELSAFAQGGVAVNESATTGMFAGGGMALFKIHTHFNLVLAFEGLSAPLLEAGWQPHGRIGLRYALGP